MRRLLLLALLLVLAPGQLLAQSACTRTNCVYLPITRQAELPNLSPAPAPGEVQVRSVRIQRPVGEYWNIIGEVVNPTSAPVYFVQLTLRMLDASGRLVAVADGYATLDDIYLGNPPATAAAYTVAVTGQQPSSFLNYRDAVFVSTQTRDNFGLELFGEVRNPEAAELRSVEVMATFYDAAGNVVDIEGGYVSPVNLAAGATGTYSLKTFANYGYASYTVQAQGYVAP
jgi:hypothetical protein